MCFLATMYELKIGDGLRLDAANNNGQLANEHLPTIGIGVPKTESESASSKPIVAPEVPFHEFNGERYEWWRRRVAAGWSHC